MLRQVLCNRTAHRACAVSARRRARPRCWPTSTTPSPNVSLCVAHSSTYCVGAGSRHPSSSHRRSAVSLASHWRDARGGGSLMSRRQLSTLKEGEEAIENANVAAKSGAEAGDNGAPSESVDVLPFETTESVGIGLPPPPPPILSSSSSSSSSGIGLPPPPPPISSSSGSRFNLPPPPPPLNIAGVGGGEGGSSVKVAATSRSSSAIGSRQTGRGSAKSAGGGSSGSRGPKKIVIDDILSGRGAAPATTGSISVLPPTAEQTDEEDDEDEHVDAHVTIHPLTTAQSRAEKQHGALEQDSRTDEASLMGLLPGKNISSDNDKDLEQLEEEDDDDDDDDDNDDDENSGTNSNLSDLLAESRAKASSDSSGGSTTILPRADISTLLPPSVDEGVGTTTTFRSKSLLPSVDFLFDGDGNKKKKLRVGTGIPDAYRIKKDDKGGKTGTRGRDERSDGAVVKPSVLDQSVEIKTIRDGPHISYDTGMVAQLAKGCVMASSGKTLVMSTIVHESSAPSSASISKSPMDKQVADAVKMQCRKHTGLLPLTVTYSERYAGVGKIPTNQSRRDNMRPTAAETLASRAIDRALRPLLPRECYGSEESIEITCSVQAFDASGGDSRSSSGDPVAVAINAASSALLRSGLPFTVPVGAVRLCLDCAGTVIFDPSPEEMENAQLDLLVAATKNDIVMIEFGGNPPRAFRKDANDKEGESVIYANRLPGIPEEVVADLLRVAHASIEGIIEEQERDVAVETGDDTSISDAMLMADLGLDSSKVASSPNEEEGGMQDDEVGAAATAKQIIEQAYEFISARLRDASQRLFGSSLADADSSYIGDSASTRNPIGAAIHDGKPLLAKSVRGRREHLVRQEILRLLSEEFVPIEEDLSALYQNGIVGGDCGALDDLVSSIHERLLKGAMCRSAIEVGTRGDGRAGPNHQGLLTVRPIEATVPLLPDVVHGSALFSRGETQVLCTTTLGAPREGLPIANPYAPTSSSSLSQSTSSGERGPYDDLPVGSLRFLKNQQALESDMNSKRVKADREMTGDSGSYKEARRAFLHYDFPSYSTGETRKPGPAVNRRAISHGSLAERGILPILPPPAAFPYTIRMTSEVTSSNGSSSMASVCGATLALLDAGVPILAPAAGVSVGLVRGETSSEESYGLLLDITGTEDHYGEMDLKVAGTDGGLTAMQLDVKRPVPLDIVIQAMHVAKEGRAAILSSMKAGAEETSAGIIQQLVPRRRPKASAPRVEIVRFDPARKRDLIGPGGAVLKQLEDRYGVSLDLSQEGQCLLYGNDASAVIKAKTAVQDLVADVVEGEVYEGTVIDIRDFGAVVELLRNKEGLLHVSELGFQGEQHPEGNLGLVRKELEVGDKISVRCIGVDPVQGHIKLSRRQLLQEDLAI